MWRPLLALLVLSAGCADTARPVLPVAPPLAATSLSSAPARAPALPPDASRVGLDDLVGYPELGWQIPRQIAFGPEGRVITYLASERGNDEMVLWAAGADGAAPRVVLRAADLATSSRPKSQAEELRDERQRKRISGITEVRWAARAATLVVPAGGDVYVRQGLDGPISRLTSTDEPELDPQPSPDGANVAFVRGAELFVIDVATGRERAITRGAASGITRGQSDFNGQEEFDEPSGFWWSQDGKHLAYLEVDERPVAEVEVHGHRKGEALKNTLRYPRSGTANPVVRLHVADVATGRSRPVTLPASLGASPYLGRVRWSPAEQRFALQALSRDQRRREVLLVDAAATQPTARSVHQAQVGQGWLELTELAFVPDGSALLVLVEDGAHVQLAAVPTSASTPLSTRLLTRGAWDVFHIAGVSPDGERIYLVANRDQVLGRHLYELTVDSGALRRIGDEPGVHDVEVHAERGLVADVHSARDRLPSAVIRKVDGAVVGALPVVDESGRVRALGLRAPEPITFEHEGAVLHGALLGPRALVPGARHPLLLAVYGGPGVQTVLDRWSPRLLWQHLADRGFYVLQVDNRGSSGRGPGFAIPIAGRLGDVELADQLAAVDHVLAKHPIDPERVGIYGHSYGGYLALAAMLRLPSRFRAGVAGSPVTDWSLYDTGYTERYMGTPSGNPAGYAASDLAKLAPALQGDLLVLHALLDENVHFAHTAKLLDALVAADRDFDLVLFPGERHGYRSPSARRYANRRVIDHLVRSLGGGEPPVATPPARGAPPSTPAPGPTSP